MFFRETNQQYPESFLLQIKKTYLIYGFNKRSKLQDFLWLADFSKSQQSSERQENLLNLPTHKYFFLNGIKAIFFHLII